MAVPAEGSTVGQLLIELQPLFCGGVGQIRPHNCFHSQTGTAASLHPPKHAVDCSSTGQSSVNRSMERNEMIKLFYEDHAKIAVQTNAKPLPFIQNCLAVGMFFKSFIHYLLFFIYYCVVIFLKKEGIM